ncbi:SDR family oxidoreductase [Flavobacterium sp. JP2137]|uniref:SDR family oxidoreductase n=1 Tax=Flavobacterium sp. JP2137 TaxID=3414510 RepID=UPI003D2FDF8E
MKEKQNDRYEESSSYTGTEPKQSPPGSEHQMKNYPDHGEYSYRGTGLFTDKVVLITGGDSGIGKAAAIAFAREGADVVISYLSAVENDDAHDTQNWIAKEGRRCLLVQGDITDHKHCKSLVEKTIKAFGKIDVLINNAAFQMEHENLQDISIEEWQKTFNTNVHPLFYLLKYGLQHIPKGGSIINTTSVNVYDPNPGLLGYASTKAALQNLTASLSKMLLEQDKGIRVNAVAPGPIWTPLIPTTISKLAEFGDNTPIGRPGQPAEIAPIYVFLASPAASYISGAIVPATGGRITL